MPDPQDVPQFISEQAVTESGQVEDDYEAVACCLHVASEAG
jgi:hypothetical protein